VNKAKPTTRRARGRGREASKDHITQHDSRAERIDAAMASDLFVAGIRGKEGGGYGAKGLTIFRDFSRIWPF